MRPGPVDQMSGIDPASTPPPDAPEEALRPTAVEALGLLAASVVAGFAPTLLIGLLTDSTFRNDLGIAFSDPHRIVDWGFPLTALLSSLLLSWLVYAVSIRPRPGGMQAFGFGKLSRDGLMFTVGLVAILLLAQSTVLSLMPAELVRPTVGEVRTSLPAFGTLGWILFALAAIVAAPIAEECVFRGILFRWLRTMGGFWIAGIVSSALFATIHLYFVVPGGVVGFVLSTTVFSAGLGFCWLLQRYRSITLCILGHALYNAVLLAIS